MTQHPPKEHHNERDAETLMMLGGFLCILAACVLVGTIWADTTMAAAVNAASGLIIMGIGGGMLMRSRWIKKSL